MGEILNAFLNNILWLFILTVISGFGVWLGYKGNRIKNKHFIKEQKELEIRGNLINYVFLILFIIGVLGLSIRLFQYLS